MSKTKGNYGYHDGYANLAAAILESGRVHNDKSFLNSEWAETLRDICRLDDAMYDSTKSIARSTKARAAVYER